MRPRNRSRTAHSTSRKPCPSVGRPGDLDDQRRVPHLEPVADAEHDLGDRDAVDARPVGAAEVRVDERPAAPADPSVMARDPPVVDDEVVVGRPPDRQAAALDRRPAGSRRPGRSRGGRRAGCVGRGISKTRVLRRLGHAGPRRRPRSWPTPAPGPPRVPIASANRASTRMSARSMAGSASRSTRGRSTTV